MFFFYGLGDGLLHGKRMVFKSSGFPSLYTRVIGSFQQGNVSFLVADRSSSSPLSFG